jgi:hypothetical protein
MEIKTASLLGLSKSMIRYNPKDINICGMSFDEDIMLNKDLARAVFEGYQGQKWMNEIKIAVQDDCLRLFDTRFWRPAGKGHILSLFDSLEEWIGLVEKHANFQSRTQSLLSETRWKEMAAEKIKQVQTEFGFYQGHYNTNHRIPKLSSMELPD